MNKNIKIAGGLIINLIKTTIMKTISNVTPLTRREREILRITTKYSADSRTVKAQRLRISENTLNNELRIIYRKLNVHREVDAIKWYVFNVVKNIGIEYNISNKFFKHVDYLISA